MSVCSEVKRTLVKSPPELWSELSDPESLSRHLGGVGEVRITSTKPETEIDWEADGASGRVRLEPSGFGTKVVLSLSREVAEPTPETESEAVAELETEAVVERETEVLVEPEAEALVEPEAVVEPESIVIEPEPTVEPEPEAIVEPEPVVEAERATEPRRGFFARLFKRRRKEPMAPELPPETPVEPTVTQELAEPLAGSGGAHEPSAIEPAPEPAAVEPAPSVVVETPPEADTEPPTTDEAKTADVAADLATLEAEMAGQDEAMLIAMLDRLGAAHHRPFSRS